MKGIHGKMSWKICLSLSVVTLFLLTLMPAFAGVDPTKNELINGGFQMGDWTGWEHQTMKMIIGTGSPNDIKNGVPYPNNPDGKRVSVRCTVPAGDPHTLRQVVDESKGPGWDPRFNRKVVNLQADIRATNLGSREVAKVSFRLDWWDASFNGVDDPARLGDPTGVSDWIDYDLLSSPLVSRYGQWITVNPFDNYWFRDFQPRWVSVEVKIAQGRRDLIWVDNLILNGKCVPERIPEPSTLLLVGSGLAGLVGFGRRRFRV